MMFASSAMVPLSKRLSEFAVRAGSDATAQIIASGKVDDPYSAICFGALGFFVTGPFNVVANDLILRATPSALGRLVLSTLGHTPMVLSMLIGYRAAFAYMRKAGSGATASGMISSAASAVIQHLSSTMKRALPYQIPVVLFVQKFLPAEMQTFAFQLYAYCLTTFIALKTARSKNERNKKE